MDDFLFRGKLTELDPDVEELCQLEAERQARKIILIPSESTAPLAVRELLGSAFQNVYAEGYPPEETRWMKESEILDYAARLTHYRRFADPRYYKGVEYADTVESLARRRCAETFETDKAIADQLYVNVQPLSGAPANNAVYTALFNPGDTIMGMNLLHGGHLTHGSSVNRSGKLFKIVHYNVDPVTEQLDYDAIAAQALQHKPKMIIAGYSSYSWAPDWLRFREIADSVGAILLADISHLAGLIAGKVLPSPVGIAHVVSFTTHKTLCGPRGACLITHDANIAKKLDRAVFPGEQGGPHVQVFAALALTFKIAQTAKFHELQNQILKNCQAMVEQLKVRGMRIPFGGTNTHVANVDCKSVKGPDGTPLYGDMTSRILDVAGLVLNRNTIPGDKTANNASGIRFGSPWITQRGLREPEAKQIADMMADIMQACRPFIASSRQGMLQGAKIDFNILEDVKLRSRSMTEKAGIDFISTRHGYPHYFFMDDKPKSKGKWIAYDIHVNHMSNFINYVFTSNCEALKIGDSQKTAINTSRGPVEGILTYVEHGLYRLSVPLTNATLAATWLRDLSDGYIQFDDDIIHSIPGPVVIQESKSKPVTRSKGPAVYNDKAYFVGCACEPSDRRKLPEFKWKEPEQPLRRSVLYDTHKNMGAKMTPFAGWEMPVWYTSVMDEHLATRKAAGLFDVSHMGIYQLEGNHASAFLDCVCANDITGLSVGESCYTHFLDPGANVLDDVVVYRRDREKYLVVGNAVNDDRNWAWLNAVKAGKVRVDNLRKQVRVFGTDAILRNLRDYQEGADMLIDIALQGPISFEILMALGVDAENHTKIMMLPRTNLCEVTIGGFKLLVARTGYTGEKTAFELFVHPDNASELWQAIIKAGTPLGLKPCGLGSRDSLRTEFGQPLFGHELGGPRNLGVGEAGFGTLVKTYKPWFIGRSAFLERENNRKGQVVRFRFDEKGVRMAKYGDPVLDLKGRDIGFVTSCAIDSDGMLTGQAYIEKSYSTEGTSVKIYQKAPKSTGKSPVELAIGDRVILPDPATIISRFMKL